MKGKFVASARHLGRSIWKNRACYSLMLPGIIWFILFAYGPMSGLLLAFKTYSARGGIWGSPWCGFENFAYHGRFFDCRISVSPCFGGSCAFH